jgi:hypothetical protein
MTDDPGQQPPTEAGGGGGAGQAGAYGQAPYGQGRYGQGPYGGPYGEPAYGQPPYAGVPYGPPGYPPQPANGLGTAGLVCGIVGLVFGLIPFMFWLAIPLGILGLVFGLVGRSRAKAGRATNGKPATIGAILGGLAIVASAIWFAVAISWLHTVVNHNLPRLRDHIECVQAANGDPAAIQRCNDLYGPTATSTDTPST